MKSPVAFIIFNRPECTAQTFAAIRAARPPRLLVVADGPRTNRPEDAAKCLATRKIVDDGVDWPCVVDRNYADANLGCATRVSSGLTWAFSQSDRLVVVEDDCLPDASFFWFCDELLERYADDTRVGQICGSPFIANSLARETSYVFSRYGPIWGWASWARAWKAYDLTMRSWPTLRSSGNLASVIPNSVERGVRKKLYDRMSSGNPGTWDYQWGYAKLTNSLLSIIPTVSLMENIGFGPDSTHTTSGKSMLTRHSVSPPLIHPSAVLPDYSFDQRFSVASCGSRSKRLLSRMVHTLGLALGGN